MEGTRKFKTFFHMKVVSSSDTVAAYPENLEISFFATSASMLVQLSSRRHYTIVFLLRLNQFKYGVSLRLNSRRTVSIIIFGFSKLSVTDDNPPRKRF